MKKSEYKSRLGLTGTIASAVIASVCCIGGLNHHSGWVASD